MNSKRIPVSYTINDYVETQDSRFVAITIDVLHTGLNLNGSVFDKEVVDENAESIKNTPVLGYIAVNDGEADFQGHEYKTVETEDGKKYMYAGSAYGVVPESCNYRWVSKVSSDGVMRDYFVVDALLWSKFEDAVSIFDRSGGKPQSMELELNSIEGEELEDGSFRFTKFKFEGCCLLSSTDDSIEPAMIDSMAVPVFSADSIALQIKEKLNQYNSISDSQEDIDMPEENKDFMLTNSEQTAEIHRLLEEETYVDAWGYSAPRYMFMDIQGDEIIVCDRKDKYRTYGVPFFVDGDIITINYEGAKKKKVNYIDLDETDGEDKVFTIESAVTEVAEYIGSQIEEKNNEIEKISDSFSTLKEEYDEIKPQYDAYVAEAQQREADAIAEAKEKEFAKFDKYLSEVAEYVALKEKAEELTLEEIQSQCAVMYVEKTIETDFAKKDKGEPMTAKVAEEKPSVEINPRYGVLDLK